MTVKFELNQPVWIRFPYPDHREVEGVYGVQYLYHVQVDGRPQRLYAHPALHRALRAAGLHAGQELCVTRVSGGGNRRDWRVEHEQPPTQAALPIPVPASNRPDIAQPPPSACGAAAATPVAPHTAEDSVQQLVADMDPMAHLMQRCLSASRVALEYLEPMPCTPTDVRALGVAIFLIASRRGIAAASTPEPA